MEHEDDSCDCPLCMEPFDMDDRNFFPCSCSYQVCRFCWNRIRMDENGLCPACRKPYTDEPADYKQYTHEELQKLRAEKRQKDQQRKKQQPSAPQPDNRKQLEKVRVVQRNLVFVVGLSPKMADTEMLKRHDFFGKYGKIQKVVVNTATAYAGTQGPSASAYVTYTRTEDALRAIMAYNLRFVDGRQIKASLGTTKYCSHFMKHQSCPKGDCMYLHELGDDCATFTKEDMNNNKHHEFERKLHEFHVGNRANNGDTNSATRITRTHKDSTSETSTRHHGAPSAPPAIQPLDSIVITPADAWPSLHSSSSTTTTAPPPILPGSAKTYASAHNGGPSSFSSAAATAGSNNIGFVLNTRKGKKASSINSAPVPAPISTATVLTNGLANRHTPTREQKRNRNDSTSVLSGSPASTTEIQQTSKAKPKPIVAISTANKRPKSQSPADDANDTKENKKNTTAPLLKQTTVNNESKKSKRNRVESISTPAEIVEITTPVSNDTNLLPSLESVELTRSLTPPKTEVSPTLPPAVVKVSDTGSLAESSHTLLTFDVCELAVGDALAVSTADQDTVSTNLPKLESVPCTNLDDTTHGIDLPDVREVNTVTERLSQPTENSILDCSPVVDMDTNGTVPSIDLSEVTVTNLEHTDTRITTDNAEPAITSDSVDNGFVESILPAVTIQLQQTQIDDKLRQEKCFDFLLHDTEQLVAEQSNLPQTSVPETLDTFASLKRNLQSGEFEQYSPNWPQKVMTLNTSQAQPLSQEYHRGFSVPEQPQMQNNGNSNVGSFANDELDFDPIAEGQKGLEHEMALEKQHKIHHQNRNPLPETRHSMEVGDFMANTRVPPGFNGISLADPMSNFSNLLQQNSLANKMQQPSILSGLQQPSVLSGLQQNSGLSSLHQPSPLSGLASIQQSMSGLNRGPPPGLGGLLGSMQSNSQHPQQKMLSSLDTHNIPQPPGLSLYNNKPQQHQDSSFMLKDMDNAGRHLFNDRNTLSTLNMLQQQTQNNSILQHSSPFSSTGINSLPQHHQLSNLGTNNANGFASLAQHNLASLGQQQQHQNNPLSSLSHQNSMSTLGAQQSNQQSSLASLLSQQNSFSSLNMQQHSLTQQRLQQQQAQQQQNAINQLARQQQQQQQQMQQLGSFPNIGSGSNNGTGLHNLGTAMNSVSSQSNLNNLYNQQQQQNQQQSLLQQMQQLQNSNKGWNMSDLSSIDPAIVSSISSKDNRNASSPDWLRFPEHSNTTNAFDLQQSTANTAPQWSNLLQQQQQQDQMGANSALLQQLQQHRQHQQQQQQQQRQNLWSAASPPPGFSSLSPMHQSKAKPNAMEASRASAEWFAQLLSGSGGNMQQQHSNMTGNTTMS